jgi:hypothetical protein
MPFTPKKISYQRTKSPYIPLLVKSTTTSSFVKLSWLYIGSHNCSVALVALVTLPAPVAFVALAPPAVALVAFVALAPPAVAFVALDTFAAPPVALVALLTLAAAPAVVAFVALAVVAFVWLAAPPVTLV